MYDHSKITQTIEIEIVIDKNIQQSLHCFTVTGVIVLQVSPASEPLESFS